MTNIHNIGDGSSGNQQIRAHGDVTAPFGKDGGVAISGDNHGIVITSVPTPEKPLQTFDIVKKTRIATPAALIGTVSGLITIAGFVTGAFSVNQLFDVFRSGNGFDATSGTPKESWWLLASAFMIAIGFVGLSSFRFLRRNVLWLPKWWVFRAWAGIKEENGRTYPYALRLAMRCPMCANKKLRFQRVPADGYYLINPQTGERKKTVVTKWAPMAVCPRCKEHSIPVNISGNDFDKALPR
ncbi:hypothetical protein [Nocardioides sp. GXZ039]|uniref:hypothetical protein n=1 Tax=Nocardioides sp. GXZ039 TaxID=3136018 RepID=UPI0030F3C07F